jgi:hypothetical protein
MTLASERYQPILSCCYKRVAVKYRLQRTVARSHSLAFAAANVRLITCSGTRPHLQTTHPDFHFQRNTRHADYSFSDCFPTAFVGAYGPSQAMPNTSESVTHTTTVRPCSTRLLRELTCYRRQSLRCCLYTHGLPA